jgi:hypothetical protein
MVAIVYHLSFRLFVQERPFMTPSFMQVYSSSLPIYPLFPGVAEAQTAFNVYLTPQTSYVATGPTNLYMYGGVHTAWWHGLAQGFTNNGYLSVTDGKPFVYFQTTLPTQGQYLVDVTVGGNVLAKLRHQTDSPDVWDYRALPYSTYHYVTVEPYAPGYHYWYFWTPDLQPYIYSVTIRSYP